jgi:hypothetical protein
MDSAKPLADRVVGRVERNGNLGAIVAEKVASAPAPATGLGGRVLEKVAFFWGGKNRETPEWLDRIGKYLHEYRTRKLQQESRLNKMIQARLIDRGDGTWWDSRIGRAVDKRGYDQAVGQLYNIAKGQRTEWLDDVAGKLSGGSFKFAPILDAIAGGKVQAGDAPALPSVPVAPEKPKEPEQVTA